MTFNCDKHSEFILCHIVLSRPSVYKPISFYCNKINALMKSYMLHSQTDAWTSTSTSTPRWKTRIRTCYCPHLVVVFVIASSHTTVSPSTGPLCLHSTPRKREPLARRSSPAPISLSMQVSVHFGV